jgi:hypothetical protein
MRTTRIEIEGAAGHVAVERPRDSATIRIDSIVRDPKPGEQAWKTWEFPARVDCSDLLKVAEVVQCRCDGVRGTGSDIHAYYSELERFAD